MLRDAAEADLSPVPPREGKPASRRRKETCTSSERDDGGGAWHQPRHCRRYGHEVDGDGADFRIADQGKRAVRVQAAARNRSIKLAVGFCDPGERIAALLDRSTRISPPPGGMITSANCCSSPLPLVVIFAPTSKMPRREAVIPRLARSRTRTHRRAKAYPSPRLSA